MAAGNNVAIAQELFVSSKTLEAHVRQILQKFDLHETPNNHRRVLAVLKYLKASS